MANETLSCPYCNSSVTLPRSAGAGQRLRCPRCHELFPYRAGEEAAALDPAEAESAFGDAIETRSPRPWSNRSVALVILSVMGVMAAIGFTFAWFTTETRRQRDHLNETAPQPSEIPSVAPAKLAAVGYLPAETDAIAGIHVAELMARPETASILRLMRADRTNFGIRRLEQIMGVALEDLDHVLLGLKVKDEVLGRVYLIVQTRQPYDQAKVRATLHAGRTIHLRDKTVYHIAPEQTELGGALWCAGAQTLVLALQPKDLEDIPGEPIAGVDRFSPETQKLLAGLEQGTQAWLVGSSTNWDTILSLLQLLGLLDEDRKALTHVRTFSGWLRCTREVHGQIEIACTNEAGAEELDQYLARKGLDAGQLEQMKEDQPRSAALLTELAQSFLRHRNGERVHLQGKVRLESILQALPQQRPVGARAAN